MAKHTRMFGFRDRADRKAEFEALAQRLGYTTLRGRGNVSEMLRDLVRKAAAEGKVKDGSHAR